MGHSMSEMLLKKGEPIVKQILKIANREVRNLEMFSSVQPLKTTLFVLTILNHLSVLVEMLKQFIHFSTYMMRRF